MKTKKRSLAIGLDYDGTVTEDPSFWQVFIRNAHATGHRVFITTLRYEDERIDARTAGLAHEVIYTGRNYKRDACARLGVEIDIWIDDMPDMIDAGRTL